MVTNLLDIHHGFNFRDLGGYKTQDGRQVRMHRLIRSGRLSALSDRDQQYLVDYGVGIDVDFRSPREQEDAPDRVPKGVSYHFTPVFPVDETKASAKTAELRQASLAKDPLGGFKSMVATYQDLVGHDSAKQAYRKFFDLLLGNDDEQAVLFHCAVGKDRTGMGAVFLLTALGVDPLTVRQDYLASNRYLVEERERNLKKVEAAGGSPTLMASIRSLSSVTNEYLDAALLTIQQDYESLEDYLTNELQLTPNQRRDLQGLYLTA